MKRLALHQGWKRAGDVSLLIRPLILQLPVIFSSDPVGSRLCRRVCDTAAESTTALQSLLEAVGVVPCQQAGLKWTMSNIHQRRTNCSGRSYFRTRCSVFEGLKDINGSRRLFFFYYYIYCRAPLMPDKAKGAHTGLTILPCNWHYLTSSRSNPRDYQMSLLKKPSAQIRIITLACWSC